MVDGPKGGAGKTPPPDLTPDVEVIVARNGPLVTLTAGVVVLSMTTEQAWRMASALARLARAP
jgi:hypothetical protein